MKRIFLVVMMIAISLSFGKAQTGQPIKKVAILEVVDRDNSVNYGVKLLLRTSLAKAITQTPGYEGYDRVDMGAIQGEQDFQRTGMVSDEQIKRLGEMTGAAYVLVAEAAKLDANNVIVTAKVLDVETAKLERTDYEQMGIAAKEMSDGCQAMSNRLFGTQERDSKRINTTPSSNVVFRGSDFGKDNNFNKKMSQIEMQEYLGGYYNEYSKFVKNKKTGLILTCVGGAITAIGGSCSGLGPVVGMTIMGTGVVCLGVGVPLLVVSNKKIRHILELKDGEVLTYQAQPALTIESARYGFGLGLRF